MQAERARDMPFGAAYHLDTPPVVEVAIAIQFQPIAELTAPYAGVFWQLLARDLARFGPPFDDLSSRRMTRLAGDLAVQGKGELLVTS